MSTMSHELTTFSSIFNSVWQTSLLSKKKNTLFCWHISEHTHTHTHTEGFPTLTTRHFHSHSATQQPAVIKWSVNYRTAESAHTQHVCSHKHIYTSTLRVCVLKKETEYIGLELYIYVINGFSLTLRNKSFNLLSDWEGHTHTHTHTHTLAEEAN